MLYEAVRLPRTLQRLPVPELRRHYREDANWNPDTGQQIPVQIEHIEALSETNLVDFKLDDRDIRLISRAIAKDGIYIGRNYVVRQIAGTRLMSA